MQTLVDIEMATINIRLQAIKEAILRSRSVFIIATVGSVAMIMCCWNAYLSWHRSIPLQDELAGNQVTMLAQKAIIEKWTDSLWINLTPLGIKLGVGDISVMGCLGLLVISIWFFYAVRRENHTMGSLLEDTEFSPDELRELIFHSITSNLLFVSRRDDRPHSIRNMGESEEFVALRRLLTIIFFLPAVAAWGAIIADLLSLWFIPAVFRMPHEPLLLSDVLTSRELPQLGFMLGLSILMAWYITRTCKRIYDFEVDMKMMLDGYQDKLIVDPPKLAIESIKSEAEKRQTWLVDSPSLGVALEDSAD